VFTGIVEACVPLLSLERRGAGARLVVPSPELPDWRVARGESIAVCGTCLTVADLLSEQGKGAADRTPGARMSFDLSAETLERTWLGEARPGRLLNLERALQFSDRLGGHLVAGHVDGVGEIAAIAESGDGGRVFTFEVPPELERFLADKGSITLDGVSLTVIEPRGRRFDVALIAHTLSATSLGSARVGQRVDVEVDLIGKWVDRLIDARSRGASPGAG
jgi:riboflavin synthase